MTTTATATHVCNCSACNGLSFTAPVGYITGTPKAVAVMIHNYAGMVHNGPMAGVMAARGLRAV